MITVVITTTICVLLRINGILLIALCQVLSSCSVVLLMEFFKRYDVRQGIPVNTDSYNRLRSHFLQGVLLFLVMAILMNLLGFSDFLDHFMWDT